MAATTHPPAVMAASDASASAEGFWGEITSTIDWCEDNYAVSHYIAEFWNTVSSLLFVAAGVLGLFLAYRHRLENRYFWLNGCVIVIGCGSTMFHGTLQFGWQLWDEIPMIYTALVWVFLWVESATLRPRFMWLPWAMAAYGVLWTVLHTIHGFVTGFHANFGTLQALGILYAGYYSMFVSRNRTVFWLGNLYVWSFFIAFFFWNIDQIWCGRLRPFYLHAWWHSLMAFNCFMGTQLQASARADMLSLPVRVSYVASVLPYATEPSSATRKQLREA